MAIEEESVLRFLEYLSKRCRLGQTASGTESGIRVLFFHFISGNDAINKSYTYDIPGQQVTSQGGALNSCGPCLGTSTRYNLSLQGFDGCRSGSVDCWIYARHLPVAHGTPASCIKGIESRRSASSLCCQRSSQLSDPDFAALLLTKHYSPCRNSSSPTSTQR